MAGDHVRCVSSQDCRYEECYCNRQRIRNSCNTEDEAELLPTLRKAPGIELCKHEWQYHRKGKNNCGKCEFLCERHVDGWLTFEFTGLRSYSLRPKYTSDEPDLPLLKTAPRVPGFLREIVDVYAQG